MGDLRDNYWFDVIRDELAYSEEYLNLFENPNDCINILLSAIMFISENKGYPARITHYLEQIDKDYSFQKEYIAEKLEILINDLSLFEGITDTDIDSSMTNVFNWVRKNKHVANDNELENKKQQEDSRQPGTYFPEFYIADVREKIVDLSPNEQIKYILAIKTKYRQTDFQMDHSGLFTIDTFEQGFIAKCDLEIDKIRETIKIDEAATNINLQKTVHNTSQTEKINKAHFVRGLFEMLTTMGANHDRTTVAKLAFFLINGKEAANKKEYQTLLNAISAENKQPNNETAKAEKETIKSYLQTLNLLKEKE